MSFSRPSHLFVSSADGCLYDVRPDAEGRTWFDKPALRTNFAMHHVDIKTVADLKATLRAGQYAWPGGYQLYFITSNGEALSFDAVRENFRECIDNMRTRYRCDWNIVACHVNYEDNDLVCAHTGKLIPAAYGDTGED